MTIDEMSIDKMTRRPSVDPALFHSGHRRQIRIQGGSEIRRIDGFSSDHELLRSDDNNLKKSFKTFFFNGGEKNKLNRLPPGKIFYRGLLTFLS